MRAPSTGGNIKLFYLFARCLLSIYGRNHRFLLQPKVVCNVGFYVILMAKRYMRTWALVWTGSLETDLGTGCLLGINSLERRGRGRSGQKGEERVIPAPPSLSQPSRVLRVNVAQQSRFRQPRRAGPLFPRCS